VWTACLLGRHHSALVWLLLGSTTAVVLSLSLLPDKIRYRARVAYDGSAFSGFQLQKTRAPNSSSPCPPRTVQGELERVLNQRFLGGDGGGGGGGGATLNDHSRGIKVVAASRTDAGVHARGQAIHFDVPMSKNVNIERMEDATSQQQPDNMLRLPDNDNDLAKVCDSINKMLTPDIRMWNLQRVPFDCKITKAIDATTRRALRLEEIGTDNDHDNDDDAVVVVEMADFQWNVLFDSTRKLYSYRLCMGPVVLAPLERHGRWHVPTGTTPTRTTASSGPIIHLDDLQRVLSHFVGTHDFAAFAGAVERSERKTRRRVSTIRTVFAVSVIPEDEPSGSRCDGTSDTTAGYCRIDFELKGALYKQVRNMVGTALDVCLGNVREEHLVRWLSRHESYSRVDNPSKPAPPQGLTLEHVYFEDPNF
jgi:tRNA pseudouridine38-40 synthase